MEQIKQVSLKFFMHISSFINCISFSFPETGFTLPQVTMKNGARWSALSAFIKNFKKRSYLKVMTFAQVEKVLIDKSKFAYGVQYRRHGHLYSVYASKEIILSAGAVGSPQILMLSGIGPKEHLEQFGVWFCLVHH